MNAQPIVDEIKHVNPISVYSSIMSSATRKLVSRLAFVKFSPRICVLYYDLMTGSRITENELTRQTVLAEPDMFNNKKEANNTCSKWVFFQESKWITFE